MTEKELRALLADMTMEEKAGQLLQFDGALLDKEIDFNTGIAARQGFTPRDQELCGSVLNLFGADRVRHMQREYMEKHPHHIPLLFMLDIINGYDTVFPIPLAQGCSFSPELVEELAAMAAREAYADGVHVTFSPMADLVADCRWGRVMESTGEDPWLNARMAAAAVRGYQGGKAPGDGHIAACLKHFAGYGLAEAGREYNTVEVDMRTLLEDHLPAYRAAVEAGCRLTMASFNTIDRVPSTCNGWLLGDVLRRQMGFDGTVISDYNAVRELIDHGVAEDAAHAAELAVKAGVEIDMTSPCFVRSLPDLVASGSVPEELVDKAVMSVLRLKNELGLFEDPFRGADAAAHAALCLCEKNRATARKAATRSFVLLKNEEGILPLATGGDAAFIGPYCDTHELHGAWSNLCDAATIPSIHEAVAKRDPNAVFAPGCAMLPAGDVIYGFGRNVCSDEQPGEVERMYAQAAELARRAKTVVLCLGEHRLQSGEGGSRANPALPENQMELLRQISRVNSNIVLVVFSGRPLILTEAEPLCRAILMAWFPGTEGAEALCDVLYGDDEPGGRLSMCLPRAVGQLPLSYRQLRTGRPLLPHSPKVRFLSTYQDCPNTPLYPFGFGLGYTTFECSAPKLSSDILSKDDTLTATATVRNTGARAGRAIVQLYLRDVCGSVSRPMRELKGVQSILLEPGEERSVSFTVDEAMLRFYRADMEYRSEAGQFELWIGLDSATENAAQFRLQ